MGGYAVVPGGMGLDSARKLEFLLANGLGGYCSSTVLGLNTRKYHGLLVSSRANLERRVVLEQTLEELTVGGREYALSVVEYGNTLDSRGFDHLLRFTAGADHAVFEYEAEGVQAVKTIQCVRGSNALVISYSIANRSESDAVLKVRLLVNSRDIDELNPGGRTFTQEVYGGRILGVSSPEDYIMFYADGLKPSADSVWYRNIKYSVEDERGEASVEDVYSPGFMELNASPGSSSKASLTVVSSESEDETAAAFQNMVVGEPEDMRSEPAEALSSAASSFIVESGRATVVAGYHWFMDWGRDTMISLPGLTLVTGNLDACENILAGFIDNMRGGRIPTKFTPAGPEYYDFDGTLWMLDRLKEYVKYAGADRAREFITPRWNSIASVIDSYSKRVEDGLFHNRSGTWMDTLERDYAVEVQALWHNGLCVVEELSELLGESADYATLKSDFNSSFMDRFWNGSYLNDCLDDQSMRPNQVISASLDYSPLPKKESAEVMRVAEEELLTPCGLKTLSENDQRYAPRYVGGVGERERAYHNGTVWPWLLGPYCRAAVLLGGDSGRRHSREVLEPVFSRLGDGCLGTLNEVYDADEPHTPRGAVSQAWSVAEVLRAWAEDAAGQV